MVVALSSTEKAPGLPVMHFTAGPLCCTPLCTEGNIMGQADVWSKKDSGGKLKRNCNFCMKICISFQASPRNPTTGRWLGRNKKEVVPV